MPFSWESILPLCKDEFGKAELTRIKKEIEIGSMPEQIKQKSQKLEKNLAAKTNKASKEEKEELTRQNEELRGEIKKWENEEKARKKKEEERKKREKSTTDELWREEETLEKCIFVLQV